MIKAIGKELGAAIGGTRAELQIGHSGKIISPKIYIAFGISGSSLEEAVPNQINTFSRSVFTPMLYVFVQNRCSTENTQMMLMAAKAAVLGTWFAH